MDKEKAQVENVKKGSQVETEWILERRMSRDLACARSSIVSNIAFEHCREVNETPIVTDKSRVSRDCIARARPGGRRFRAQ